MPLPKDLDPYTDPRAFYGAELRRLREAAGLSQGELGTRVFCSGTYIGQFEMAERRPQLEVSRALDEVLGSGEHLQRLCRLARTSKVAGYFADAAELEKQATSISEYAPVLMPGLLQTRGYAAALTRVSSRFISAEAVEEQVSTRMERAELLRCDTPPAFWAILHESALRVPVGGPEVMGDQLNHLTETVRTRPHIILQVLPFSAGVHPFLNTMASLMDFADGPPVAYTESAYTGQLIDEPRLVGSYRSAYDLARAVALSPEASLALVESAAKDYSSHEYPT
ncbi:helix-turn-helix protein [Streptomyces brevispora]|uniref:Helix-turn-helix protein n=1 Tax=Streptomyces brevispora TaxID=887462 RepID=A0A561V4A6_9ACTN|nr:helix-turn-helix transcriptional regulator [Streptomyces brevispora]TWG06449.1 helix-turn-helix protein [Streptomyces brevispora]